MRIGLARLDQGRVNPCENALAGMRNALGIGGAPPFYLEGPAEL